MKYMSHSNTKIFILISRNRILYRIFYTRLQLILILITLIFSNCIMNFTLGINHQIYKDGIEIRKIKRVYYNEVEDFFEKINKVYLEEYNSFLRYRFVFSDESQTCLNYNPGPIVSSLQDMKICSISDEKLINQENLNSIIINEQNKSGHLFLINKVSDNNDNSNEIFLWDKYEFKLQLYKLSKRLENLENLQDVEIKKIIENKLEIPIQVVLVIEDKDWNRQFFFISSEKKFKRLRYSEKRIQHLNQMTYSVNRTILRIINHKKVPVNNPVLYYTRISLLSLLYPVAITIDSISFPVVVFSCLSYMLSPYHPERCDGRLFIPKYERYKDPRLQEMLDNYNQ